MQITKENYELFAIDYIEGNLTGNTLRQMERFLSEYPEIKAELQTLGLVTLPQDNNLQFKNKAALLRPEWKSPLKPFWAVLMLVFVLGISLTLFFTTPTNENSDIVFNKNEKPAISKDLAENTAEITVTTPVHTTKKEENSTPVILKTNNSVANTGNNIPKTSAPTQQPALEEDKATVDVPVLAPSKNTETTNDIIISSAPINAIKVEKTTIVLPESATDIMIAQEALHLNFSKPSSKKDQARTIKTPFGKIKFSEIRDALLPESYLASVK